ncbi:intraflagellar transport protein 46 homolog [Drosophila tropicalis]|uniref:intraflagellar transport protein 46 homolog n=1 Tax=Drosophila tropicalis TaxID=46794 RepID=UPI0035AB8579
MAMNYYDEEITINERPNSKHLSSVQMDRSGAGGSSGSGGAAGGGPLVGQRAAAARQRGLHFQGNSTDDDGLLQDIIDHDDEAEESDDDDDDSEMQIANAAVGLQMPAPAPRPQTRPGSTRNAKTSAPNDDQLSSGSDEALMGGSKFPHHKLPLPTHQRRSAGQMRGQEHQTFNLTPDKWEQLPLPGDLKELFPYILKYTPQSIDTPYHLQPFIPEFVPAVGDVDAFLKVQAPALIQPQSQQSQRDLDEHLQRLGLWLLDEPSGAQSEPSLLNMKLRSVLSGNRGPNPRHASSASLVPTARSAKDIDKWINEVEQVHMTQSLYDAQPRKDIDALMEDWPRSFGDSDTKDALEQAYRLCLQQQISLSDYIRLLCERFGIEGPLDNQTDYIHNVQTLFALYLAASQAWE